MNFQKQTLMLKCNLIKMEHGYVEIQEIIQMNIYGFHIMMKH